MKQDVCRTCGAPIVWCRTQKGKRMPVDAEPVSAGKFVLEDEEDDEARVAVFVGDRRYTGERYSSHFATCPNAKEHSGRPRQSSPVDGVDAGRRDGDATETQVSASASVSHSTSGRTSSDVPPGVVGGVQGGRCRPDGRGFCATHPTCELVTMLLNELRRQRNEGA